MSFFGKYKGGENMDGTEEMLELAKRYGLENDYFFVSTLERYEMQLRILNELKAQLEDDGLMVTKEYVKGRKNLYSHPAIANYNKTSDSANKTAAASLKMIETAKKEMKKNEDDYDPLLEALNGSDDE